MKITFALDEIPDDLLEFFEPDTEDKTDVWRVTTKPLKMAHFATFPPDLIEPMILAGTSERGVCPQCGAPWERVIEKSKDYRSNAGKAFKKSGLVTLGNGCPDRNDLVRNANDIRLGPVLSVTTLGWRPTCACEAGEPIPATVMDPFSGAGTTGLVAAKLGREYIGIELKSDYNEMARERLATLQPVLMGNNH